MADGVGDREHGAGDLKVVLQARSDVAGGIEDENVVRLGGGDGVVVEVIHDGAGALGGESDAEFVE